MFEHHKQPLISPQEFTRRLIRSIVFFSLLIAASLGIGILGYHFIAGLRWIDALLNASMILTGMGPVSALPHDGAKIFASAYALFSGVVFLVAVGVVLAPMLHRVMHRFHLETEEDEKKEEEEETKGER